MLRRKKFKVPKISTVIGSGTTIKGDLSFTGGLHIDGSIQGSVIVESDDASALTLSEQGTIEGDVRVPYIVLNGQVTGDVYASERVELAPNAKVSGTVYYKMLEMAMGAQVNGKLVHSQENVQRKLEYSGNKKGREPSKIASKAREAINVQQEAASSSTPEPGKRS